MIDALVAKRLMVKDTRDGQVVVEVALESLLRQWDELAAWLAEERQNLQSADDVDRNTAAWAASNEDPAWLLTGTRLTEAETLAASPAFGERLAGSRDYLAVSRQAETDRERIEQDRREAELRAAKEHADTLRRRSRVLQAVLAVTAIVAVIALVASVLAFKARNLADERANDSRLLRDVSDAQFMLADKRPGGDVRALQQILAVNAVKPSDVVNNAMLDALIDRRRLMTVSDTGGDVAAVSSSGRGLVLGAADQPIRVLDAKTGKAIGSPIAVKGRGTATMSMDGRRVVAETSVGNLQAWDVDTGQAVGTADQELCLPHRHEPRRTLRRDVRFQRETSSASGTSRRAGPRPVTRSPPRWALPQRVWRSTKTGSDSRPASKTARCALGHLHRESDRATDRSARG